MRSQREATKIAKRSYNPHELEVTCKVELEVIVLSINVNPLLLETVNHGVQDLASQCDTLV